MHRENAYEKEMEKVEMQNSIEPSCASHENVFLFTKFF
jgi:hypothetical protein